jgi:hypothetical protein
MPRKQKFQAVVLSVRIPDDKERNYSRFFKKVFDLRKSVQVYPGIGMALTSFNEKTRQGTISKFSIIEVDGEWFDERGFGPASADDLKKISIPDNLRPNLVSKPIYLDENDHLLSVMTYSVSKSISPIQVEKFFRAIASLPEVVEDFGAVQIDLFKDAEEIEELLKLTTLKELKITISRPNHIPPGVIREIEESLKAEKADEMTRVIKSKDKDFLKPSQHTQALGVLAAENGSVSVKYEEEGATLSANSESKPLVKTVVSDDPETTEIGVFQKMTHFLFNAVRTSRARAQRLVED